MQRVTCRSILPLLCAVLFAVPAAAGWNPLAKEKAEDQGVDNREIAEAIAAFKNSDSTMQVFFDKARGYVVFPTVAKGGIGIGGAYGKGTVFERGKAIGSSSLTQLTVGLQLGGQAYREIIFFADERALERFKSGKFEFGAQASAVAVTAGASANADYNDGVAIFTLPKGGLMYEASVGGQKFSYTPLK